MSFYSVSHNTFHTRGFPWINSIRAGLVAGPACKVCGASPRAPHGDLEVTLDPKKGREWPDILGCGAYPLFVISGAAAAAWREGNIGEFPRNRIEIVGARPKQLESPPPDYYWVDGSEMLGALLDFESSGFVGVKFCPECRARTEDVGATYERQASARWPLVFIRGSWGGAKLFTTDLSPAHFFCTDEVLECAKKYRLTNFRFIPSEDGFDPESKGVKYLSRVA